MMFIEIACGGLVPLVPIPSCCNRACKRRSAEQVTAEVAVGCVLNCTSAGTRDTLPEPRFHN